MLSFAHLILSISMFVGVDDPPKLVIKECEFGDTYAFNRTDCEIALTNTGTSTIQVKDVLPVTPRDSIRPTQIEVKPEATVYLHALINTGNSLAGTRHRFNLKTDEPAHEERMGSARGFVLSALDQVAPKLDFGVVDMSHPSPKKSISLSTHETERFQILKVLEQPDYVNVELGSDRHTLSASIKSDASWGMQKGFVKLAIDTPNQREVWVAVNADLHGEIVAAANPIDLGLLRFGNDNEYLQRLTSKSGKDFELGAITLDGFVGKTDILPCIPQADGCRLVRLRISDQQPAGAIRGSMLVSLPGYAQKMRVDVHGLILARDAHVDEINPFNDNSSDSKNLPASVQKSSDARRAGDLGQALKSAVSGDRETPPGNGPLLKWTVANGKVIHGFQVFRANSEDGPFVLVNKKLIKSIAEDENAESYQYRDNTAESGKTYWYYVGSVFNDGHKQQLTGPQRVVAK